MSATEKSDTYQYYNKKYKEKHNHKNFDNGANYRSFQMNLLGAHIGTVIHYNPVRILNNMLRLRTFYY